MTFLQSLFHPRGLRKTDVPKSGIDAHISLAHSLVFRSACWFQINAVLIPCFPCLFIHPLQYSCLENPMDRGAWWAAVDRVTKNWQLSTHKWADLHLPRWTKVYILLGQIDYILCSQRWRSSIQSAKTRPGADYGSDHELRIAKFRLKLKKVGKTTRSFRYDLIQIFYDYTVEVRNWFKGLGLIECLKN